MKQTDPTCYTKFLIFSGSFYLSTSPPKWVKFDDPCLKISFYAIFFVVALRLALQSSGCLVVSLSENGLFGGATHPGTAPNTWILDRFDWINLIEILINHIALRTLEKNIWLDVANLLNSEQCSCSSVCFLNLFAFWICSLLMYLSSFRDWTWSYVLPVRWGANRRIWQMAFVPGNEEIIKYTLTLSVQIAYFQSYDFWLSWRSSKNQNHVQQGNNLSGIPPVQQNFLETDMKLR